MERLSRRSALRSFGLVAGGAGAVAPFVGGGSAAAAVVGSRSLTLFGSGLRVLGPKTKRLPGSQVVVVGALALAPGAEPVGELVIHSTLLAAPSLLDPGAGALETDTFILPGGTLVGTGVLHQNGTGLFAVTGGTGEFAGARGSYTVTQDVDAFAGGTAQYTFTLAREVLS